MKKSGKYYLFGFWDGMPYGEPTDEYDDFVGLKNRIAKQKVLQHVEELDDWLTSEMSVDRFTGERFNAGFYEDGPYRFSVDFIRYYKTHEEIGIPYEYEDYLMDILE